MSERTKFHINPEKGPMPCEASSADSCIYGRQGDPHFSSVEDAFEVWQKNLSDEYGSLSTTKLDKNNNNREVKIKKQLVNMLESDNVNNLSEFVNSSSAHYRVAQEYVKDRVNTANKVSQRLQSMNPFDNNCSKPCNVMTYKSHIRDQNSFIAETFLLSDICRQSRFSEI